MSVPTSIRRPAQDAVLRYDLPSSGFIQAMEDRAKGQPALQTFLNQGEVILLGASILLMLIMLIG